MTLDEAIEAARQREPREWAGLTREFSGNLAAARQMLGDQAVAAAYVTTSLVLALLEGALLHVGDRAFTAHRLADVDRVDLGLEGGLARSIIINGHMSRPTFSWYSGAGDRNFDAFAKAVVAAVFPRQ